MLRFLVLILASQAWGREVNLKVDPRVHSYKLIPHDITKKSTTVWNVRGNEGSKLIFTCRTEGQDCSQVSIVLKDKGKTQYLCWEWSDQTASIDGHEASLTIETEGTPYAVYCNVTGTKSYMNVEEVSLETDEEGIEVESKPTCPCGWANKESERIVGGKETKRNEYPFAALVGVKGYPRPDCGGSIITPYHILTAAHCTDGRSNFEVTIGEHKISDPSETPVTKVISVKKVYQHELYEPDTLKYDISLLYLAEKIEYSKYIGPVCMPNVNRTLVGEHIKVMGWGKYQYSHRGASDVLMKVNLRVIDLDICKKVYPTGTVQTKDTQLCTYHTTKDSCSGDSGGPVVWLNKETNMYTQHGLVSYGNSCNTTDPAVNTNVYYFMDWIEDKIKASKDHHMCY